jgi:hypothetical protein
LFRHYWVVAKLMLTTFATVILLVYLGTFREMAGMAADPVADLDAVKNASPLIHSVLALIVLMIATVLGVYKPGGMTAYGRRMHEHRRATRTSLPRSLLRLRSSLRWCIYWGRIVARVRTDRAIPAVHDIRSRSLVGGADPPRSRALAELI